MMNFLQNTRLKNTSHLELMRDYSLEHILHAIGPLPDGSALLGIGYDRLPVLVNLSHAQTGAILIVGEPGSGKTALLTSILRCAALLNPDQVSITMISAEHYTGAQFKVSSMHLELCRPSGKEAARYVETLVLLARKRLANGKRIPFILFAIEDLAKVYGEFEMDERKAFRWLLENGPSSGIWPICTLTAVNTYEPHLWPDVVESFGTCLWGHIQVPGMALGMAAVEAAPLSRLIKHREFCLRLDSGWLRFHIIDPSDPPGDGFPPSFQIPDRALNATQGGRYEYWHVMV